MCGISVVKNGSICDLRKMTKSISHRGIKNRYAIEKDHNVIVGFNWLPITDSDIENPWFSCGDVTCWLNGYISNYKELAVKHDIHLTTNCDTELLAKFLEKFGGENLDELNGFFAVVYAIDEEIKYFTDRYGIKQLYEYSKDGTTYICSEVKGILAVCPDIKFSSFGVADWKYSLGVMNRHTIYKGIKRVDKLPFDIPETIDISYEDAVVKLRELWEQSLDRNRCDNLQTGVFLSGGIDSGIIAKGIDADYSFSVDYLDDKFSEIDLIKENSTGKHFTLISNESSVSYYAKKTMKALDDLKVGSCYTNFALTELASQFCTVLYSGAGGDEIFGGYPHRNNREVSEVIKRTNAKEVLYVEYPDHFQYNMKYLEGIFVVEDKLAGFFAMETRYPLLDNDFVNFALSLPMEYRENKRILKDISGLSENVLNGKKKGFSNPHFTNEQWVNFTLKNKGYGE